MTRIPKSWVRGGLFLGLTNVGSQILSLALNVILARLLGPADFGLLALSATAIGVLTVLTNASLGSAVIHYSEASQEQISTLYWLSNIQAFWAAGLTFLVSPWIASFYGEPELNDVIRGLAPVFLIGATYSTHWKILQRDLRFGASGWITVASAFVGGVVAILAALSGWGVYSLVANTVVTEVVRAVMTRLVSDWRPAPTMRLRQTGQMIWYAMKYKAAEGALYAERNVDYAVLGRYFSPAEIGYYAFAYNIMYAPVKRVSYIFGTVLFPAMSAIKNDPAKVVRVYFSSSEVVAMITFPVLAVFALFAPELIVLIFGDKWLPAIALTRVLCVAGAIQSIGQMGGTVFVSTGAPQKEMYLGLARALLVVGAIVIGKPYGLLTIAYLLVAAKVISYALMLGVLHRHQPFAISDWANSVKRPLLATIVTLLVYAALLPLGLSRYGAMAVTMASCAVAVLLINRGLALQLLSALPFSRAPRSSPQT